MSYCRWVGSGEIKRENGSMAGRLLKTEVVVSHASSWEASQTQLDAGGQAKYAFSKAIVPTNTSLDGTHVSQHLVQASMFERMASILRLVQTSVCSLQSHAISMSPVLLMMLPLPLCCIQNHVLRSSGTRSSFTVEPRLTPRTMTTRDPHEPMRFLAQLPILRSSKSCDCMGVEGFCTQIIKSLYLVIPRYYRSSERNSCEERCDPHTTYLDISIIRIRCLQPGLWLLNARGLGCGGLLGEMWT